MTLSNRYIGRLVPFQPNLIVSTENLQCKIDKWNQLSRKDLAVTTQFTTGAEPGDLELIPDNCVEFIFITNDNPSAFILGPVSEIESIKLKPNSTYFLFKPTSISGTIIAKLGLKELYGQRIPFGMIFKDDLIIEMINNAHSFEERVNIFKDFARKYILDDMHRHPLSEHIQRAICDGRGAEKINVLASKLGFSSRYCLNKFKDSLGITIKTYSDVIRFQNIMCGLFEDQNKNFHDIVVENNLYDQAHLIHIFQRYTGRSPKEYLSKFGRTF